MEENMEHKESVLKSRNSEIMLTSFRNLCLDDNVQEPASMYEKTEINHIMPVNNRALPRYAPTYELEMFKKNALIIFKNDMPRNWNNYSDIEILTNTFEQFGFEVTEHIDLTVNEIMSEMKKFTSRDFTEYGCIGVVIITYGRDDTLRASDDVYTERDILDHLYIGNKSTLLTKPKFVIIRAPDGRIRSQAKARSLFPPILCCVETKDVEPEPYHLPEAADILLLRSTYPKFIETLCETIERLAHSHDFETIITEVMRKTMMDQQGYSRSMTVSTSTLIRKLYLKKFGEGGAAGARCVLPAAARGPRRLQRLCCCLCPFHDMRLALSSFRRNNQY